MTIYNVTIKTGDDPAAGTRANVRIQLIGELGETDKNGYLLENSGSDKFDRGAQASFEVKADKDLGQIEKVRIWHDNTGGGPGWYLDWINVELSGTSWRFPANRWLAKDEEDKKIDVTFMASTSTHTSNNSQEKKENITTEQNLVKRPNYFAGQYLLEDDFKSEQNYHINSQRRSHRLLNVSGIAEGLNVTTSQDLTVKISAGTAFDSQGRQIILQEEKDVDLVQEANNKNPIQDGDYTLSIRYSEELTDKQGDDDFTSTRVQEKPVFVLSSPSSPPDDTIALAKLTIKEKKVTEIAQDVRWYSGINIPTEDGKGVTLRGKVGTNNQAILDGSLSITGGLTITRGLTISGGAYLHDVHIVGALQLGNVQDIKPVIRVNTIVNEIPEGTENADSALPTVKAVVDYADTIANKTGDSKSDFNAANLSVVTLTINQGVTLSAPKGQEDKQAILEGGLSITGGMNIDEGCTIHGDTYIGGQVHIEPGLKIGTDKDTQVVNRIVNTIKGSGKPDPAYDTALPTVKAAVDYADTKANKNGNSEEDFTAANLTVKKLTINQKEITAICEEINEDEATENETAIPTIAAIMKYMESLLTPQVVTGVQMTYTIEGGRERIEVTWPAKMKNQEVHFPILTSDRIKIIPIGRPMSAITLSIEPEGGVTMVEIKQEEEGWMCTAKNKGNEKGVVLPWRDGCLESISSKMKEWENGEKRREELIKRLVEETQIEEIEKQVSEGVRYEEKEGWRMERKYNVIDAMIERITIESRLSVKEVIGMESDNNIERIALQYSFNKRNGMTDEDDITINEEVIEWILQKKEEAERDGKMINHKPSVWKATLSTQK